MLEFSKQSFRNFRFIATSRSCHRVQQAAESQHRLRLQPHPTTHNLPPFSFLFRIEQSLNFDTHYWTLDFAQMKP
jgi:hypothetical protein